MVVTRPLPQADLELFCSLEDSAELSPGIVTRHAPVITPPATRAQRRRYFPRPARHSPRTAAPSRSDPSTAVPGDVTGSSRTVARNLPSFSNRTIRTNGPDSSRRPASQPVPATTPASTRTTPATGTAANWSSCSQRTATGGAHWRFTTSNRNSTASGSSPARLSGTTRSTHPSTAANFTPSMRHY
jgi:hypothetical protein